MSNYTKATNFAIKDGLVTTDPAKIIKGTEIDNEYNAISNAIASKADVTSPSLLGTPTAPTASSGTNNTQIANTSFVQSAISVALTGVIVMWSGSVASIPTGWVLCNGSNGTPDLRNRFLVGAGSTYSVGDTGGSADTIVVAHTHTFSGNTGGQSASHTHAYGKGANYAGSVPGKGASDEGYAGGTSTTQAASNDHSHAFSGTTASTGSSGTNANLPPYYALAFIMKT